MPTTTLQQGVAPAKPASAYTIVGTRVPRIDIPEKVTGTWTYMQNVRVPGMLHGRVVRPRGRARTGPVRRSSRSTQARSRTSRTSRSSTWATSSAWSHRTSTTRSRPRPSSRWCGRTVPILPGSGNLFGDDAHPADDRRGQARTRATSATASRRRRRRSSRPTRSTTRCMDRSARLRGRRSSARTAHSSCARRRTSTSSGRFSRRYSG